LPTLPSNVRLTGPADFGAARGATLQEDVDAEAIFGNNNPVGSCVTLHEDDAEGGGIYGNDDLVGSSATLREDDAVEENIFGNNDPVGSCATLLKDDTEGEDVCGNDESVICVGRTTGGAAGDVGQPRRGNAYENVDLPPPPKLNEADVVATTAEDDVCTHTTEAPIQRPPPRLLPRPAPVALQAAIEQLTQGDFESSKLSGGRPQQVVADEKGADDSTYGNVDGTDKSFTDEAGGEQQRAVDGDDGAEDNVYHVLQQCARFKRRQFCRRKRFSGVATWCLRAHEDMLGELAGRAGFSSDASILDGSPK
jgi:hypothetical protein